jgi:hypothetical protein
VRISASSGHPFRSHPATCEGLSRWVFLPLWSQLFDCLPVPIPSHRGHYSDLIANNIGRWPEYAIEAKQCRPNKGKDGQPTQTQKPIRTFNQLHIKPRSIVERVFSVLKLHYGMTKARYVGLSRNCARFELMCVVHNIKRGLSIRQACCA